MLLRIVIWRNSERRLRAPLLRAEEPTDGQEAGVGDHAVVGTHRHVQTADERVLPGGTAYITDLGLTGPTDGVIGVDRDQIIQRFLNQMPIRFETAKGPAALQGVVIVVEPETGRATSIRRLRVAA